jgi:ADP-heptose:LPS heptosyltransferase
MPTTQTARRGPTIVALRALPGLGDFLCAVPALRALRGAEPEASIHLVGLESSRDLADRFTPYIDAFHAYPGHIGTEDGPLAAPADVEDLVVRIRALAPDVAIQLHGTGDRTNVLVARFGAARVAGFHPPRETPPGTGTFLPWDEAEPEARRWLRLVRALGYPAEDDRLEFPLDPGAAAWATELLGSLARRPYVVVHPGSARSQSRWSVGGFLATAARMAESGLGVVVTGTAAERPLAVAVAAGSGGLALAGQTDLDELGWIIRGARLVVANDTGVSHLAAALGVPSVVIFTDPSREHRTRWAPSDSALHRPVSASLAEVLQATDGLLSEAGAIA